MKFFTRHLAFFLCFLASSVSGQGLSNLINQAQWQAMFPQRAGTAAGHPQGYTSDFYSYQKLQQAIQEMADYRVTIERKTGVWGERITVSRLASGQQYLYAEPDANWLQSNVPITTQVVNFSDFVNTPSNQQNKRELAAFLAHISKETTGGWQFPIGGGSFGDYALWGLYFVHEVGYTPANSAGVYSQAHPLYPPNPAKGYYGRGPIQLSWNYNYGQFSKFLFNDQGILLNDPDSLQRDGVIAFKSALWFWMMPQCPKPSCHQVMHGQWLPQVGAYSTAKMYQQGFAHTNNIINGGLECRSSSTPAFTEKVVLRSGLYKYYLGLMGFSTAEIAAEDSGNYTTTCYDSSGQAMENYLQCDVLPSTQTNVPVLNVASIKAYPSPFSDYLEIELPVDMPEADLVCRNALGQTFYTGKLHGKTQLTTSDWPKGMYLIEIRGAQPSILKVMKQ